MAKTTIPDTVVLIDDELHNLTWLSDYIESLNLKIVTAGDLNTALKIVESEIYRALIIDLNIPVASPFYDALAQRGGAYAKFPGLFVAERARNTGYRDRQVVIYSVHRDPEVSAEAEKLGCTYILKGRPKDVKDEILRVLSYDPTDSST